MSRSTRFEVGAACILLAVAMSVGYFHVFFTIDQPYVFGRMDLHQQVLSGIAGSPYRYRVLSPYLAQGLTLLASITEPDPAASFLRGFRWFDVLAVWGTLAALFWYFREFFSKSIALAGATLTGALMVIPMRDHFYQPWSLLEPGFVALGLLLIRQKRLRGFLVLVVFATLNRETAILLVTAAAAATALEWRTPEQDKSAAARDALVWTGSALLMWALTVVALRLLLGSAPSIEPVAQLWQKNMDPASLKLTLTMAALFLGPLWVLSALGWRWAPAFVRWTAVMVPVQLGLILVFGVWYEVRLLMPLYAVLLPLCLSFMFGDTSRAEPHLE